MKECKIPLEKKKYTIYYYDEKWEAFNYDQLNQRIEIAKPLIEKIFNKIDLNKSLKILDIGTGPGTISIALIDKYKALFPFYIYGIAPSSNSISRANEIVKQLKLEKKIFFKFSSFEEIPFPKNYFDVIISNAAYNLSITKIKAIDEIARVAKKDGKVIRVLITK